MATHSKTRPANSRDERIEKVITTHVPGGEASYTFTEVFEISEIERNLDSQSRLSKVDKHHVDKLAEQMKAGVRFSPVVLWETPDNGAVMVDGNHRVAAYMKRGLTSVAAYLVKLPGGIDESVYLSAVFNGAHGLPLTPDELRRAIIAAGRINPEPNNATLAADYGVSASQVGRIRTEHAIGKRLESLAVAGADDLSQGHLLPLAKISLNEPLRQAASLAIDAQMSATDVRALVKDLIEADSEAAQVERIAHERKQRNEDIAAVAAGRKSTGSPAVDLRRMISRFENLLETFPSVATWVPSDPSALNLWTSRVTRVAEFLDELQAAYGQALADVANEEASAA